MKFFLLYTKKSVPEWFACYYDYHTMKKIIAFCRKAEATKANIMDCFRNLEREKRDEEEMQLVQQNQQLGDDINNEGSNQFLDLKRSYDMQIFHIVNEVNKYFFEYHSFNKKVSFIFYQMKIHELSIRLKNYQSWSQYVNDKKEVFVGLVMNCYAEFKMLMTMSEINLEAYRKIKKKHMKSFSKFSLLSPSYNPNRITRAYTEIQNKTIEIENLIETKKELYPRQARNILTEQIQSNPITSSLLSFGFGIGIGFSISLMLANFILIGLHLTNHDQFTLQFRMWRSIGYIILYLWVTSISSYVYNRERLNESLIFNFDENATYKKDGLGFACFFSMIYSLFFAAYILGRSKIRENLGIFVYFPAILWALLLLYLIYSLITSRPFRSIISSFFRIFIIPLTFFSCLSDFVVRFSVIWATEQLISLLIPITDTLYTLVYYSQGPQRVNKSEVLQATEIIALIVFFFRGLEVIKELWRTDRVIEQNKSTTEKLIGFRCLFNITLVILSLSSKSAGESYFIAWIVLGMLIAIYNYIVDIVCDWDLIYDTRQVQDTEKDFLRLMDRIRPRRVLQKSCWPYKLYDRTLNRSAVFFLIIANFFLRFASIITICPGIFRNIVPSNANLIITIAVFLELNRRLIWNLLRVEREHDINCSLFRVRTDYIHREEIIIEEVKSAGKSKVRVEDQLCEVRKKEETETIKRFLRHKKEIKNKINAFLEKKGRRLEEMEVEAETRGQQAKIFPGSEEASMKKENKPKQEYSPMKMREVEMVSRKDKRM